MSGLGLALHMHFVAELEHCPPLHRFVFTVTAAVHTFSSYLFSSAAIAEEFEDAYGKCLDAYKHFKDTFCLDMDTTPDLLFAEFVTPSMPVLSMPYLTMS